MYDRYDTRNLTIYDHYSYLEKGIQTPKAQGRFTKIISTKWIRTIWFSMKNSLCDHYTRHLKLYGHLTHHAFEVDICSGFGLAQALAK